MVQPRNNRDDLFSPYLPNNAMRYELRTPAGMNRNMHDPEWIHNTRSPQGYYTSRNQGPQFLQQLQQQQQLQGIGLRPNYQNLDIGSSSLQELQPMGEPLQQIQYYEPDEYATMGDIFQNMNVDYNSNVITTPSQTTTQNVSPYHLRTFQGVNTSGNNQQGLQTRSPQGYYKQSTQSPQILQQLQQKQIEQQQNSQQEQKMNRDQASNLNAGPSTSTRSRRQAAMNPSYRTPDQPQEKRKRLTGLSGPERAARRQQKNREAAQRFRYKKENQLLTLEEQLAEAQARISELENKLMISFCNNCRSNLGSMPERLHESRRETVSQSESDSSDTMMMLQSPMSSENSEFFIQSPYSPVSSQQPSTSRISIRDQPLNLEMNPFADNFEELQTPQVPFAYRTMRNQFERQ